jgi:hypothetical protein
MLRTDPGRSQSKSRQRPVPKQAAIRAWANPRMFAIILPLLGRNRQTGLVDSFATAIPSGKLALRPRASKCQRPPNALLHRTKTVTHVSGMKRDLCGRNRPEETWSGRRDSNPRPRPWQRSDTAFLPSRYVTLHYPNPFRWLNYSRGETYRDAHRDRSLTATSADPTPTPTEHDSK